MPIEVIEDFFKLKTERKTYTLFYKKERDSYGDYSIMRYAFSEVLDERIIKILLLKDNEN